ncbi:hypothetical protein C8Q80DRAFT_1221540 [Daedaleopsis nitida]|nr:hypothetical protein C8Q80DRAFT_1221540 [Daedaleopsis nitida]
MKVQGYLVDYKLPPVRQSDVPRNPNRIIDMKQFVPLTGVGAEQFERAVGGVVSIYEMFKADLQRRGFQLRPWSPAGDGHHLALTFANRYLTTAKESGGERPIDINGTIDPLNVLTPHLRTEVHILKNVVEYWQQEELGSAGHVKYSVIKPELFYHSNMVEVQVAFQACYVFLPKLRAICLLNRAATCVSIFILIFSPLKKVKRRVGYGEERSDGAEDDSDPPQTEMKRLCLSSGDGDHRMEGSYD